jgi:hypothetical protein
MKRLKRLMWKTREARDTHEQADPEVPANVARYLDKVDGIGVACIKESRQVVAYLSLYAHAMWLPICTFRPQSPVKGSLAAILHILNIVAGVASTYCGWY